MHPDIAITIIVGTLILMLLASFTLSVLFAYQKRYYKHLQEISSMKERYEQEILKTRLEIREQTMQHISQEIHDNIGQILSLVNLQLTSIETPGNEHAATKIDKSMELVSRAITDLRDLSRNLNAENITRTGLKAAIAIDLGLIEKPGTFTASLQVSGNERRLEPSREIVIYRMVQEALSNIIKHAKASRIAVTLQFSDRELRLGIEDDGIGFDERAMRSGNSGAGLKNMASRTRLIHGDLSIRSAPGQGTKIDILIPFMGNQHTET